MNVSWNSNIYAMFTQNSTLNQNNAASSSKNAPCGFAARYGADSVQISQDAINAMLEADEQDSSYQDDVDQKLSESLTSLVSAGTISDEQADAVSSAIESSLSLESPQFTGNPLQTVLDSLVAAGTISSEQETAIAEALAPPARGAAPPPPPPGPGSFEEILAGKIDSLVSDGTISEEQAEAVTAALTGSGTGEISDSEASEASNPLMSVLDELVSDGTISSEQETAIAEALAPPRRGAPPPRPPQGNMEETIISALDSLTEDGTISEGQEKEILNALLFYSSDVSSENEVSSFREALDSLFSSGIIDEQQQEAIEDALLDSFARILGL